MHDYPPTGSQHDTVGRITSSLFGFAHVAYSTSISSRDEWNPVGTNVRTPSAANRGYIATVRNHFSNPEFGQGSALTGLGRHPGISTSVGKLPRIKCQVKAWRSSFIGQPPTSPTWCPLNGRYATRPIASWSKVTGSRQHPRPLCYMARVRLRSCGLPLIRSESSSVTKRSFSAKASVRHAVPGAWASDGCFIR